MKNKYHLNYFFIPCILFLLAACNTQQEPVNDIATPTANPIITVRVSEPGLWHTPEIRSSEIESLIHKNIYAITEASSLHRHFLYLDAYSRVIFIASGDLNHDGFTDFAVVVEFAEKSEDEYRFTPGSPRHIYILLGDEHGGHIIAHKNESLIPDAGSGGRFGDAFDKMFIEDGFLIIHYLMGSAWSTSQEMRFAYTNGNFKLTSFHKYDFYSVGPHNQHTSVDFINHMVERHTWRMEDESVRYNLYNGTIPERNFLFDEVTYDTVVWYAHIRYLPDWNDFRYIDFEGPGGIYESVTPAKPCVPASQVLDIVMKKYHPDFDKVYISLTRENAENYCRLLFYEIPLYYYRGEDGILMYRGFNTSIFDTNHHHVTFFSFDDTKFIFYSIEFPHQH
ncbi:MAG: hypothetical protein FWE90_07120 [Defluviitaleaceae bacterium]|nr:hypothetical protein [Defluviitaleaceae bacterium]